jgi:hypothetical protein
MGYHQLAVDSASQEKLAFQGVDTIKWTYTDSIWKELAKSHSITINDDTNTRIIVDDIVNWGDNFQHSL